MTDGFIKVMVALADAAETAEASKCVIPTEHTGTPTEIVLKGMLTENTGCSILDSGSAYGRNWQLNQGRDFDAGEAVHLKFGVHGGAPDIEIQFNVYHWLKERLEIHEELDSLFHGKFLEDRDKDNSKHWMELMNEFPEYLATVREDLEVSAGDKCPECDEGTLEASDDGELVCSNEDCGAAFQGDLKYGEFGGIYGEGEPVCVNTYNHESLLDQVLQFVLFSGEYGEFVVLQIHGGCDVRGGYTKPRVFTFGNTSELDILDNARGGIHCTGEGHLPSALKLKEAQEKQVKIPGIDVEDIDFDGHNDHHWYTDDAYHWYYQGSCGFGAGTQLEKYEAVNLDDEEEAETPWEPGKLFIKDGVGYCPHCGAKLAGSFY